MNRRASRSTALLAAALLAAPVLPASPASAQAPPERPVWRPVVMGTHAMIAAEHPLEAMAAQKALQAGGNAIDAAVAAFYMTTVVEHHQAGIGGDAFILAYIAAEDRVVFINGTGVAPRLATLERYRALGGIPAEGPFSSTVPGAVAGFDLALETWGTKGYAELLAPAIEAAEHGHPVSVWGAGNHASSARKVAKYPSSARILLPDGRPMAAGDVFVQADLARSLRAIAQGGAEEFYRGDIARGIADFYREQGGLVSREDLAAIRAETMEPVRTGYRGYDVVQSAPNSQGVAMLIALEILEGFDLKAMGFGSADYSHVVTEALKLAFADRNQYVADPAFVRDIPVKELLSPEYAAVRRGLIRMDAALDSVAPPGDPRAGMAVLAGHEARWRKGAGAGGDGTSGSGYAAASRSAGTAAAHSPAATAAGPSEPDGETSSFSIADRWGNVVSVTHSVNQTFGSGMIVEGLGFVLNNRMPYFSLEDGDVNVLAPGKRPRQTINPAMALKDGKPFLAWNTPGGDNQPQAMLQAFLAVVEFGMDPQQAVEAPTLTSTAFRQSNYPQRAPGRLTLPKVLADVVGPALEARGHRLEVTELQGPYEQAPSGAGAVKMILLDRARGVMFGGVAPAKDNYVIGW